MGETKVGEIKYLARYNRVWQAVKTSEILGHELELKDGEKLSMFREVPKPPEAQKDSKVSQSKHIPAGNKNQTSISENGGAE